MRIWTPFVLFAFIGQILARSPKANDGQLFGIKVHFNTSHSSSEVYYDCDILQKIKTVWNGDTYFIGPKPLLNEFLDALEAKGHLTNIDKLESFSLAELIALENRTELNLKSGLTIFKNEVIEKTIEGLLITNDTLNLMNITRIVLNDLEQIPFSKEKTNTTSQKSHKVEEISSSTKKMKTIPGQSYEDKEIPAFKNSGESFADEEIPTSTKRIKTIPGVSYNDEEIPASTKSEELNEDEEILTFSSSEELYEDEEIPVFATSEEVNQDEEIPTGMKRTVIIPVHSYEYEEIPIFASSEESYEYEEIPLFVSSEELYEDERIPTGIKITKTVPVQFYDYEEIPTTFRPEESYEDVEIRNSKKRIKTIPSQSYDDMEIHFPTTKINTTPEEIYEHEKIPGSVNSEELYEDVEICTSKKKRKTISRKSNGEPASRQKNNTLPWESYGDKEVSAFKKTFEITPQKSIKVEEISAAKKTNTSRAESREDENNSALKKKTKPIFGASYAGNEISKSEERKRTDKEATENKFLQSTEHKRSSKPHKGSRKSKDSTDLEKGVEINWQYAQPKLMQCTLNGGDSSWRCKRDEIIDNLWNIL